MLRVAISLILIVTQAVISAPLYICSSAGGRVRFDSGPAACIGCSSVRQEVRDRRGCCPEDCADHPPVDSFHGGAPCDCRHEPLCDDRQYVQRHDVVLAGELLVAGVDQFAVNQLTRSLFAVLDFTAFGSAHTSLADQASVRMRC